MSATASAESREPWWFVAAGRTDTDAGEWVTATVEAPDYDDAVAAAKRVIAIGEGTDAFEVETVRGPFPRTPGASAVSVRPNQCAGCGLHLWQGEDAPLPHATWFERLPEQSDDVAVAFECIQCETVTRVSTRALEGGFPE